MWDRTSTRRPIAAFNVPPHAPVAVAEANQKFTEVGDTWGSLLGEIDDARESARKAKGDAKAAVTAAALAGKPSKVSIVGVEQEHLARVQELEEQAGAVASAVDEVGNDLAHAVAANRDEWLAELAKAEADATSRLVAALADARKALADLAPARGAVQWLQNFDADDATVGRQQAFAGGRLHVDTTSVRRETNTDPATLLDVIAQTLEGPKPPKPRRHNVAVR